MHRRARLSMLSFAGALCACGAGPSAATSPATPCPSRPPATPPSAVSGGLLARAASAHVDDAGVTLTVVATGPLQYTASCEAPLHALVRDRSDIHVDDATEPAGSEPCGTITLPPAATAHYTVRWTPDGTLPPGPYRVALALGDLPPLNLDLTVGADPGCA